MARGIVLVLGGLGLKGVANIGILQSLRKHNVRIDKIVTSGMSSVVGAQFALGRDLDVLTEHLVRFFDDNERYLWGLEQFSGVIRSQRRRIVNSFSYFLRRRLFCRENMKRTSILSWEFVESRIESLFGNNTFSDLKVPLAVSAIDISSSTEILIEHGDLVEGLKAGIAFTGLFPPVRIADRELVSSILYCESPLGTLVKSLRPIVVIDISNVLFAKRPRSLLEIIAHADEVRTVAIKQRSLNKADRVFHLESLSQFRWGNYRQIPQLVSMARGNMDTLLDSAEMPLF